LPRSNEQKITKRDLMRTRLHRFTRATPEKQEEKDMQKTLRTLKVVLIAALLGASAASSAQQGLSERWQTFGAPAPGSEAVNPGWAGAMFYRTGGGGGAANIYVNGEYLASLLPGGYRYAELCPYNQRLAAAYTGRDRAYGIKANAGEFYDLPQGHVSYFRVVDTGGGPAPGQPTVCGVAKNPDRPREGRCRRLPNDRFDAGAAVRPGAGKPGIGLRGPGAEQASAPGVAAQTPGPGCRR